jgi:hypothetical protein
LALVTSVKGLLLAIGCSQPGIELGSTNADDTKVKGNIQMNPAELAASTDDEAHQRHRAEIREAVGRRRS